MRHLSSVALSVSLSALAAFAIVRGTSIPQPDLERSLSPIEPEAAEGLASRLNRLERQLEAQAAGMSVEPIVTPRTELSGQMDLEKRLAQLEAAMAELLQQATSEETSGDTLSTAAEEPYIVPGSVTFRPHDPLAARHEMNNVLLDPFASEAEKVAAHKALRRVEDAYAPGSVQELLVMAQVSSDPDVRADVWTHFDGTTDVPQIVPALVSAIHGESNDAVRVEAVETLGNYLDDPQNRMLLKDLAKNDSAQAVRDRALRTLKEHPALND